MFRLQRKSKNIFSLKYKFDHQYMKVGVISPGKRQGGVTAKQKKANSPFRWEFLFDFDFFFANC